MDPRRGEGHQAEADFPFSFVCRRALRRGDALLVKTVIGDGPTFLLWHTCTLAITLDRGPRRICSLDHIDGRRKRTARTGRTQGDETIALGVTQWEPVARMLGDAQTGILSMVKLETVNIQQRFCRHPKWKVTNDALTIDAPGRLNEVLPTQKALQRTLL